MLKPSLGKFSRAAPLQMVFSQHSQCHRLIVVNAGRVLKDNMKSSLRTLCNAFVNWYPCQLSAKWLTRKGKEQRNLSPRLNEECHNIDRVQIDFLLSANICKMTHVESMKSKTIRKINGCYGHREIM